MSNKSYSGLQLGSGDNTDVLPLELELSASSKMKILNLILIFLLIGVAFNINNMVPQYVLEMFDEKGEPLRTLLPLGIVVLALFFLIKLVFRGLGRRTKIRIDGNAVTVQSSSIIGKAGWSEPLYNYRGVRWTRFAIHEHRRQETSQPSTRYRHVIELVHADAGKTVPLFMRETGRADSLETLALARKAFAARDLSEEERKALEEDAARLGRQANADDPREHWERFSTLLNLPAIDARDGAENVRAAENVDKSIKELAAEGKVDKEWDATSVPSCLRVESVGNPDEPGTQELHIVIRAGNTPVFLLLVFSGIAAVMLVAGLLSLQFGLVFGGLLFGGIVYAIKYFERRHPRQLTVTRSEMRYEDPMVSSRSFTMPLGVIESIEIRNRDTQSVDSVNTPKLLGKKLLISSDGSERAIAGGTPEEGLIWLRGYLASAIADA